MLCQVKPISQPKVPNSETLIVVVVAVALVLLAVAAKAIFRETVHPAVAFAAIWATLLALGIAALQLEFHRIEPVAAGVFLVGALLFAFGAVLGERLAIDGPAVTRNATSPIDRLNFPVIAAGAVILNIAMLPQWWAEVTRITDANDLLTIGFRMRWLTVLEVDGHGSLVGNWMVLGLIVTPILALGVFRGHLPAWVLLLACGPWVFANLISSGRAGVVQTVVAIAYLRAMEHKPIDVRSIFAVIAVFAVVFGGGVLLVQKSGATADSDTADLGLSVITNLLEYVAQGPILFSRWLAGMADITPTWDALLIPCKLLQAAGLCVAGGQHQEFSEFGEGFRVGNVYTVYFSILPKYGWIGLVYMLIIYGAWATFHHRRHAQRGHLFHTLLAAQLFSAVLLSGFADTFAPSLNFMAKTVITCALLERFFTLRSFPSTNSAVPITR